MNFFCMKVFFKVFHYKLTFVFVFFVERILAKVLLIKWCWSWPQVSTPFHEQLHGRKVFCWAFMCQFLFVFFWHLKSVQKSIMECWWNWLQGLFFSMFFKQLFLRADPESTKKTVKFSFFLRFWDLCEQKLLIKCWWNWSQVVSMGSLKFDKKLK